MFIIKLTSWSTSRLSLLFSSIRGNINMRHSGIRLLFLVGNKDMMMNVCMRQRDIGLWGESFIKIDIANINILINEGEEVGIEKSVKYNLTWQQLVIDKLLLVPW